MVLSKETLVSGENHTDTQGAGDNYATKSIIQLGLRVRDTNSEQQFTNYMQIKLARMHRNQSRVGVGRAYFYDNDTYSNIVIDNHSIYNKGSNTYELSIGKNENNSLTGRPIPQNIVNILSNIFDLQYGYNRNNFLIIFDHHIPITNYPTDGSKYIKSIQIKGIQGSTYFKGIYLLQGDV